VAKKRLLALFLGLALLCSFTLFPLARNSLASASPDKLKWSVVDTPSEEDYVVVNPSEVNAFVLGSDDETLYAIDIPTWHDDDEDGEVDLNQIGKVYKSTDGGVTWEDDLTEALVDDGATLPAWDITVAPNDPELLAVVTDDRQEVYISEDGGKSWKNTRVSDATDWNASSLIADVAISAEYDDGSRDIAIGTRNPGGATNGDVWVVQRLVFAGWKAQELSLDATSVRFSPDYDSDKTILAIASDADNTYLCTGFRDTDENTTYWNVTDPPRVEICEYSEDSPRKNGIIFSNLVLPAYYSGDSPASRLVYAAYSSNTAADDVYRIEDTNVYRLDVKRGARVSIASIAYHGGKLLAGEVRAKSKSAEALIHICFNPGESEPAALLLVGLMPKLPGVPTAKSLTAGPARIMSPVPVGGKTRLIGMANFTTKAPFPKVRTMVIPGTSCLW